MEEENNYIENAINIKKVVIKKNELDKQKLKSTSNNLNLKIKDIIRENKLKNRELEIRMDRLSNILNEELRKIFLDNTNSKIINLNTVFKEKIEEYIDKENNDKDTKKSIEDILEGYKTNITKQVYDCLEAFKIPQREITSIMIDVENRIGILINKTIFDLEEHQENLGKSLINYIKRQYEEYVQRSSEENNELNLKGLVNTDEEIAKLNANVIENKDVGIDDRKNNIEEI